jgi:hypothetical protein
VEDRHISDRSAQVWMSGEKNCLGCGQPSLVHRPFVKTALNISTLYVLNVQIYRVLPPSPQSSKRPLQF